MINYMIKTVNLSKTYYIREKKLEVPALNNVNISIKSGEKFGLLGPNAAGKTTLVNILTTLIPPTSGKVIINGFDVNKQPKKARNYVSLMLDSKMSYTSITAYNNLVFFARIYNVVNYKQKIYDI